ncbi:hypothetical protein GYH30_052381 [Glycine max]|nr:hypothetical protein GYH30_052381 [Glycine max]
MARPSKPHSSSYEALSNASCVSEEKDQVNEKINEEEGEEEIEVVVRPTSFDDDDEVTGENSPDSYEDPATANDTDDD